MAEETENTTVEEEVETEVAEREAPKKTTKVETKQVQSPTQKVVRKEVQHEEKREEVDHSDDLKYENIKRRKENQELKRQIQELTESFSSARSEFEAVKKAQEDRIIRATLTASLNKAGCLDPETAMTMLAKDVKFNKNGDVENDAELIEQFKASKAYFFTGPATTQTQPTPRAAVSRTLDARNMDDNEFNKLMKSMGIKIP